MQCYVCVLRSPLKGILFWRWDAVAAAVNSQIGDNALTLATSSSVFQVSFEHTCEPLLSNMSRKEYLLRRRQK